MKKAATRARPEIVGDPDELLSRDEVIARFCRMSRDVMETRFAFGRSADCMCRSAHFPFDRYENAVMLFIEGAVRDALLSSRRSQEQEEVAGWIK